uniref:IP07335p n=1 Tax=Drosophila melanogaster TaxID=7227 RepID=Q1EC22_DROME|nr:IP07335p [Drosophila melanogaster]
MRLSFHRSASHLDAKKWLRALSHCHWFRIKRAQVISGQNGRVNSSIKIMLCCFDSRLPEASKMQRSRNRHQSSRIQVFHVL